jgi:glycosyltransferase involved in cell wall biosynthesis
MKVSLITVTYNSEKYIETCIKSVINQDYLNIEYIIIDGNSNDNTKQIINEYKDNISMFISENDKGIYDALNKGIEISTGDIVGLLHSDDLLHDNNVISRIVKSFQSDTDCVYSDSYYINQITNKKTRYYSSNNFTNWKFSIGLMPSHPTIYFRSKVLKEYQLYNINYKIASDFDLILRHFISYKCRSKYIKDIWVIMREGGVSTLGYSSKIKITKELLKSCRENKVYTNKFLLSIRYLFKLYGYLNFNF